MQLSLLLKAPAICSSLLWNCPNESPWMPPRHSPSTFLAGSPSRPLGFVHNAPDTQVQLSNRCWGAKGKPHSYSASMGRVLVQAEASRAQALPLLPPPVPVRRGTGVLLAKSSLLNTKVPTGL